MLFAENVKLARAQPGSHGPRRAVQICGPEARELMSTDSTPRDALMRLGASTAEAIAQVLEMFAPGAVERGDVSVLTDGSSPFTGLIARIGGGQRLLHRRRHRGQHLRAHAGRRSQARPGDGHARTRERRGRRAVRAGAVGGRRGVEPDDGGRRFGDRRGARPGDRDLGPGHPADRRSRRPRRTRTGPPRTPPRPLSWSAASPAASSNWCRARSSSAWPARSTSSAKRWATMMRRIRRSRQQRQCREHGAGRGARRHQAARLGRARPHRPRARPGPRTAAGLRGRARPRPPRRRWTCSSTDCASLKVI